MGLVYISHRLAEVPLIGQRVTVMRDGKVVGSLPVAQADEPTLVNLMVGRRLTEQYPKNSRQPGRRVLRAGELAVRGELHGVSLELREGEILGIFGLMGAGQPELARAIFGLERLELRATAGSTRSRCACAALPRPSATASGC